MLLVIVGPVVLVDNQRIPIALGALVTEVPRLAFLRSNILLPLIVEPTPLVTPIPHTLVAVVVVLVFIRALMVFCDIVTVGFDVPKTAIPVTPQEPLSTTLVDAVVRFLIVLPDMLPFAALPAGRIIPPTSAALLLDAQVRF